MPVTSTLIASGALLLPVAAIYAYVGRRLAERPVPKGMQRALTLFVIWWYGLAGSTLLTGGGRILAGLGVHDLASFVVLTYLNFLFISMALCGLLFYLIFLFTGSGRSIPYIAFGYAAYFLAVIWALSDANPTAVELSPWSVGLAYAQPVGGSLAQVLLALLIVPPILGAAAYLSLVFRVDGRTQRYRILMVSTALLIWFSSSYTVSLLGLGGALWWQVASRLMGLGAAVAILWAYLPPGWIQQRYGIEPLEARSREPSMGTRVHPASSEPDPS